MPLGEKLWEETSKATGIRYLDASEKGLHCEVSFAGEIRGSGRMEGIQGRLVGTDNFWENLSEEGILTGTAYGALHLQSGEIIPFRAVGLGKVIKRSPGAAANLVSLIHFINPPAHLSWMKNTPIVWDAVVDPQNQAITATAYEWGP
jgi:hypothetical protein